MKKMTAMILILCLTLGLTACGSAGNPAPRSGGRETPIPTGTPFVASPLGAELVTEEPETRLPAFARDYEEIYKNLASGWRNRGYYWGDDVYYEEAEAKDMAAEAPAAAEGGAMNASGMGGDEADYSGTNVQVEGIDEGDIVKTDGKYIYALSPEGQLRVIRAEGPDSKVVARVQVGMDESKEYLDGGWSEKMKNPREMFIGGGRLAILSDYERYGYRYSFIDDWNLDEENRCCVDFYDISDPERPVLLSSLGQDGYVMGSRLLEGHVYVVTRYSVWDFDEDDPRTFVPMLYEESKGEPMAADCIAICGESASQYVVVSDYDLATGSLSASEALLGYGGELYMSAGNLYILCSRWDNTEVRTYTESIYTVTEYLDGSSTEIYRFDLSGGGLRLAASGSVPGYIESQFSADEKDGLFRIVTSRNGSRYLIYKDEERDFENYKHLGSETGNDLYVLDLGINIVGSVTGLAEDEYVYSVRFDGNYAYFCTFRTVDPLFTVDLSAPRDPVVLSALKISGFSEYLHSWGEGRLFGFGREADESTGWAESLKLVMFDTSDKTNVTARHTLTLDAWYSEALYDHRAIFIRPEKNLIGFVGDGDYYVFAYDDELGFKQLAHFDLKNSYDVRGLYIGDWVYIVDGGNLAVASLSDWSEVSYLNLD